MLCSLLETNLWEKKIGKSWWENPWDGGPLIINPIYTLYSESLLGPISPFKGLLGELFASQGTKIHPVVFSVLTHLSDAHPQKKGVTLKESRHRDVCFCHLFFVMFLYLFVGPWSQGSYQLPKIEKD